MPTSQVCSVTMANKCLLCCLCPYATNENQFSQSVKKQKSEVKICGPMSSPMHVKGAISGCFWEARDASCTLCVNWHLDIP